MTGEILGLKEKGKKQRESDQIAMSRRMRGCCGVGVQRMSGEKERKKSEEV